MILTNFGRRVQVQIRKYFKNPEGEAAHEDVTLEGVFHHWGYNSVSKKGHPTVMQTVAIVELEDGKCCRILPEFVTFLQPMRVQGEIRGNREREL